VHALGDPLEPVEVPGVALPVPGQPVEDRRPGDVLDRLHHRREVPVVARVHGREGDAAVADDDRGHPVPARGRRDRVPGQLGVEVGVHVDEARGHEAAVGGDLAPAPPGHLAHRDDGAVGDPDVGRARGPAEPVGEPAAADHEVERHDRRLGPAPVLDPGRGPA
jgi:hypothetical protein